MDDRGSLTTEHRNARSADLDRLSVRAAFDVMSAEDARVAGAVAEARDDICRAIDLVVDRFERGGRLIYVGAGTSGRLGVLDAAECPPTFLSDPRMVQGVIAGGAEALTRSVEGAEDRSEDGTRAVAEREASRNDVVFAIATGGTTPFVHGAIEHARQRGAATVLFACVPKEQVPDEADVSIRVITGPEVLTGSTRLKAGTATKLVLNMVSTIAMTRLGKVYRNLMVDVNTGANAKLRDRALRMIEELTDEPRDEASRLLETAAGRVKTALVMHARGVDCDTADGLLADAHGRVGEVLDH